MWIAAVNIVEEGERTLGEVFEEQCSEETAAVVAAKTLNTVRP